MYWFVLLLFHMVSGSFLNETENRPVARIGHGYETNIQYYPFAAFLFFDTTKPASCGSTLIMVQAVLTAAHCVDELRYRRGQIRVFFGSTVPENSNVVRRVVDFELHPNYKEAVGKFDMAVAFLNSRVPLGHRIAKIPLAGQDPPINVNLMSVGWGRQRPGLYHFSYARELRSTKQYVIDRKQCENPNRISPRTLCTRSRKGWFYKDDAGNGLVLVNPDILVGVLSHVTEDDIAIYTNVFTEKAWIIRSCYDLFRKNCKSVGRMGENIV